MIRSAPMRSSRRSRREADPGLSVALSFDPQEDIAAPYVARGARPAVAILREQGVNSQVETAAVFDACGFAAHDVHMTDLLGGRRRSRSSRDSSPAAASPTVMCWARARAGRSRSCSTRRCARSSERFFARADTFALGICNGCQMFAALKSIIPGTAHWPRFVRNRSEQYEARFALVEVLPSPSVLLAGMAGSVLPIAVAHGEGRAEFANSAARRSLRRERPGGRPLRQRRRQRRHHLPGESERHAVRHRGALEPRWPRHHHHAAPGALVPLCAEFLAAARRRVSTAAGCGCSAMRGASSTDSRR